MAVTGVKDYTNTYAAMGSGSVKGGSGLSKTAQNYLSGLMERYPDVNLTVADFANDKQKLSYMMGSSGGNNVAISANMIEKMATDFQAAAKYEKIIADAPGFGERAKKFTEEHDQVLYGAGVVIDRNGKVSYWMVGGSKTPRENPGTAYKQKVQKQLEEKRAEKKEEEKRKEKRLKQAETEEKLLEKIRAGIAENDVTVKEDGKGAQVDFTV